MLFSLVAAMFLNVNQINYNIVKEEIEITETEDQNIQNEEPEEETITFNWDPSYKVYHLTDDEGYSLGYLIMHKDGTYDAVDKETAFAALEAKDRYENNSTPSMSESLTYDEYIKLKKENKYNSYENEYEAKINTAIEIDSVYSIPDDVKWDIFSYNGKTYYMFKTGDSIFNVSKSAYTDYINGNISIYDDFEAKNGGYGTGTLNLHLDLSEGLLPKNGDLETAESFYVVVQSEAGDELTFLVNPPSYNYYAQLDSGKYQVIGASSYEYPEYPIKFEKKEFEMFNNKDYDLKLSLYREQDMIQAEVVTDEDIQNTIVEHQMEYEKFMASESENQANIEENTAQITIDENKGISPFIKGLLRTVLISLVVCLLAYIFYVVYKKIKNRD